MSPFGYLPPEPTGTALEQKEQQVTAAILARTVTPAPTSGVLPVFFCATKDCDHWSDGPGRLCPVCAPNPRQDDAAITVHADHLVRLAMDRGGPLPPVPNSCYPIGASPLEESA